jgi:hypothetical protein
MKIDFIIKEEIMRSLPVYIYSFLIIGFLDMNGYISVGTSGIVILAFLVTVINFSLMVWYRKKEYLYNPSIFLIIDHFLSKPCEGKIAETPKKEKTDISSSIRKNVYLLIFVIFLYICYLYASLVYQVNQIFWVLFLLFMGFVLSKIIYDESTKEDQKDPMKLLVFYIITCVFIFVRYFVLGYPIYPILNVGIIFGILLVLMVLGKKWSQRKKNSNN